MNVQGKIVMIGETNVISDKFKKRDVVLECGDNPQYLQNCIFEAHQDKVSILDNVKVGDHVNVEFNLNGRAWTPPEGPVRYFNTLAVWKIESSATSDISPKQEAFDLESDNENDTLPF